MDKIITRAELLELRNDIEFVGLIGYFCLRSIVCFYCDARENYIAGEASCKHCYGALDDGFVFVGVIGDIELFVKNECSKAH